MQPTNDQINQLQSLGITTPPSKIYHPRSNIYHLRSFVPLLSISGLTFISLGGLILLKNNNESSKIQDPSSKIYDLPSTIQSATPTQVPKSIQHYLLASQQYFSQALQLQSNNSEPAKLVELVNQSILVATDAIKLFPSDYRGYEQRAHIYQSLSDSQVNFVNQSIADYTQALRLNPSSAEITRSLASLYAKNNDVQNTLNYLTQTVSLEPTKAQNFYDLARLQQQTGLIPQAIATYNTLLPLLTDNTQIAQVQTEKTALENLLTQNPLPAKTAPAVGGSTPTPNPEPIEGPLLQANSNTTGLIIAAPETSKDISVSSLTDSNSLSGSTSLPANTPSVTITNDNINSTSQVYLTTTKGGKNQVLKILSRSKESFTAGFNSPLPEDVEFKWWIIN